MQFHFLTLCPSEFLQYAYPLNRNELRNSSIDIRLIRMLTHSLIHLLARASARPQSAMQIFSQSLEISRAALSCYECVSATEREIEREHRLQNSPVNSNHRGGNRVLRQHYNRISLICLVAGHIVYISKCLS